jgi:hypothetical protein
LGRRLEAYFCSGVIFWVVPQISNLFTEKIGAKKHLSFINSARGLSSNKTPS